MDYLVTVTDPVTTETMETMETLLDLDYLVTVMDLVTMETEKTLETHLDLGCLATLVMIVLILVKAFHLFSFFQEINLFLIQITHMLLLSFWKVEVK